MIELLVLLLAMVIVGGYLRKRDDRFPPGPTGLNIFGPLPMLCNRMDKTLRHLKKTNGPIIGVRLGTYRAVIINDAKLIREALGMKALSGRPRLNFFTDRSDDGLVRGIVPTDGPHWMEQRSFQRLGNIC
ncbi:unnamed protein product [Allacma fusca]|uniref:Cytochrome P450 n=1 Tax=Allacma fusca TaxID=39272 RepID=A0A8J2KFS5_9HEXA|nr:unnamed protein product [Allacma fusca]